MRSDESHLLFGVHKVKTVRYSSVTFEVKDTLEVQHVIMYDSPLIVEISKKDITTEKNLSRAKMKITDMSGKEIDSWTSTKKPHKLSLPKGKYILTEKNATKGYEVAESIEYEVKNTAKVQKVTMHDKPKEGTTSMNGKKNGTTTSSPASSVSRSAVKTGDETKIIIPMLLMVIASTGIIWGIKGSRKKKMKVKQ